MNANSEIFLLYEIQSKHQRIKSQLHNAPLEHCYACLGTADRRRAQWKALTRRARRSKNAEAFLNVLRTEEKNIPPGGIRVIFWRVIMQMVCHARFAESPVLKGGQTDDHTERKRIWNESSIA